MCTDVPFSLRSATYANASKLISPDVRHTPGALSVAASHSCQALRAHCRPSHSLRRAPRCAARPARVAAAVSRPARRRPTAPRPSDPTCIPRAARAALALEPGGLLRTPPVTRVLIAHDRRSPPFCHRRYRATLIVNAEAQGQLEDRGSNRVINGRVLEAEIATGKHRGNIVYIPRIKLSPDDTDLPYKWSRLQFPVRVAFAMSTRLRRPPRPCHPRGRPLTDVPHRRLSHGQPSTSRRARR